jgi:hypothetical protein
VKRDGRPDEASWSDDTPAPAGLDRDTLPIGSPAPHWTQIDTAADGTPDVLPPPVVGPLPRPRRGPGDQAAERPLHGLVPASETLPMGTASPSATPSTAQPPSSARAIAPQRPIATPHGASGAIAPGALSTVLPPRPRPGATLPMHAPAAAPMAHWGSMRATLAVCAAALFVLAALVFVYLVVAAPR